MVYFAAPACFLCLFQSGGHTPLLYRHPMRHRLPRFPPGSGISRRKHVAGERRWTLNSGMDRFHPDRAPVQYLQSIGRSRFELIDPQTHGPDATRMQGIPSTRRRAPRPRRAGHAGSRLCRRHLRRLWRPRVCGQVRPSAG